MSIACRLARPTRLGLVVVALLAGGGLEAADISANPAKVVTAGVLGGAGSEWLTTGGVLANGDILVCGITVDPEVELLGRKAEVVGKDQKALPVLSEWPVLADADTGVVQWDPTEAVTEESKDDEIDLDNLDDLLEDQADQDQPTLAEQEEAQKRKELELRRKLSAVPRHYRWQQLEDDASSTTFFTRLYPEQKEATGFWAVFSPDLQTLKGLWRLPRGAGSITSAGIAADGSLYLTGNRSDRIRHFHKATRVEKAEWPLPTNDFGAEGMWVARLAPDAGRIEWLVDVTGWSIPPVLTLLDDGNLTVHGAGLRTYSPSGTLVRVVYPPRKRVLSGLSVSPVDGGFVTVGDWMSPTGREPYRSPRCAINDPEGNLIKELWQWRGPFAGIDSLRLVADSAVRRAHHGADGSLVVSTWSHGGNNVMFRHPSDIERFMPDPFGFTLSHTCAVVALLDKDHNAINCMRFNGFAHDVFMAVDGSVVAQVKGYLGKEMANRLSDAGGAKVMVFDPGFDAIRFCSTVPAVGIGAVVHGCSYMADSWGWASGVSQGRTLLLGFSSALPTQSMGEQDHAPPMVRALQGGFGGGLTDGYLMVLDLTPDKPFDRPPEKQEPRKEPQPYDGQLLWPDEGQAFNSGGESYMNAKVVFRDQNEEMWPTYFGGNTALGGRLVFSEAAETAVLDFTINAPKPILAAGDQSQRVLGEKIVLDEGGFANPVTVRFGSASAWQRLPLTKVRRIGGVHSPGATCTVSGSVSVGTFAVSFSDATCTAYFKARKGAGPDELPNHAMVTITCSVPGADLGLSPPLDQQRIKVRVDFSAFSNAAPKSGW